MDQAYNLKNLKQLFFTMSKFIIEKKLFIFLFSITLFIPYSGAHAEVKITVLGDSLVSGYGLFRKDSFPSVLERKLLNNNQKVSVNNAGVSGDTSAGGLARLDWVIEDKPDILILVLGSNDMLRGIKPEFTEKNLSDIIQKAIARDILVLLCGMKSGENMGRVYKEKFDSIFVSLTKKFSIYFYPFFLDGVALDPKYNQDDLMHPNKDGISLIVKKILPIVNNIIKKIESKN